MRLHRYLFLLQIFFVIPLFSGSGDDLSFFLDMEIKNHLCVRYERVSEYLTKNDHRIRRLEKKLRDKHQYLNTEIIMGSSLMPDLFFVYYGSKQTESDSLCNVVMVLPLNITKLLRWNIFVPTAGGFPIWGWRAKEIFLLPLKNPVLQGRPKEWGLYVVTKKYRKDTAIQVCITTQLQDQIDQWYREKSIHHVSLIRIGHSGEVVLNEEHTMNTYDTVI